MIQKLPQWLILLILALVAFLPHGINLHDQFVSDDWDFLTIAKENTQTVGEMFTTNYYGTNAGGSYRPMVKLFWVGMYNAFGLNSFPYHLATTGFHIANVILIFLLIKSLPFKKNKQSLATLAALIFALFPNHAEAIAWISVINDTMMTFFFLLTLLLFSISAKASGSKKIALYLLSLITFSFSLLTKEMALTLPAIVLISSWYFLRKQEQTNVGPYLKALFATIPYTLIVAIFFLIRKNAIGLLGSHYAGNISLPFDTIWQSAISFTLSHFLSDELRTNTTILLFNNITTVVITIIAIATILLVHRTRYKKKSQGFIFPYALCLISLCPVLFFGMNLTTQFISEEGERYTYLPSIFMAIALSLFITTLHSHYKKQWQKVLLCCCVAVLLCSNAFQLTTKTFRWHSAARLADNILNQTIQTLQENPHDGVVLVGLPESIRGAFVFRNTFFEAIKLHAPQTPDLLVSSNRTVIDGEVSYEVARVSKDRFVYRTVNSERRIITVPLFVSTDYRTTIMDSIDEPYSLGPVHVGSGLFLQFSDQFLQTNQNRNIGIWFWNGGAWKQFTF